MQKKRIDRQLDKKIPAFHTLLVEEYIEVCQKIKINLTAGSAEIFGVQLKKNYPHFYSVPCSIPVFTWEGAEIKIEWNQHQNTQNSSHLWVDLTQKSGFNQSAPMLKYLEIHYNLVTLRKMALQQCKVGPCVAILGSHESAAQNVSKLLLNYSGKYTMNPIFIDLDPENSIFIDGSIGALQFEYKIAQDLYDRPNKICFYYGCRSIRSKTYLQQVKSLSDSVMKKIHKQIKDYKLHGTKQQYPLFASGLIIQCPRYNRNQNKKQYSAKIRHILKIFQCSHLINIDFPEGELQLSQNKIGVQLVKGQVLEGTDSFVNLPRPIKSKIQRYFNNESIQEKQQIDSIKIYELMTETGQQAAHCRIINIREETVSKNIVAVLHATISEEQSKDKYLLYQKALVSPIVCLLRIHNIGDNEVTLQVGQQHFLDKFKSNIWVTSVNDQ